MVVRSVIRQLSYGRSAYAFINKSADQRTVVDGEADVTSVNLLTREQATVRLSVEPKCRIPRRQFNLPKEAANGLQKAIEKSDKNPKKRQDEADVLYARLLTRSFPPSPEMVNEARNKIMQRMKTTMIGDEDETLDEEGRATRLRNIEESVETAFKKANFNWKPLEMTNDDRALTYALARLAPNYAEVARVLEELQGVDEGKWTPKSVLDFGAGAGGAFWALNERYGESIRAYTAIEENYHLSMIAMEIMRKCTSRTVVNNAQRYRSLQNEEAGNYDLVIVHRTLIELATEKERFELAETLWRRTNRFLILIESGLEDSFSALMDVRNFLLTTGMMMDKEKTEEMLKEHGKWNELTERLLHDERISEYERFEIIREQLPPSILPPTMLSPATVVAPCPHDRGCPKQMLSETCTLNVQWSPVRATREKKEDEDDGIEKSSISYMILEKGVRGAEVEPRSRIVKTVKEHMPNVLCETCTANKGLQRLKIPNTAGALFTAMKKRQSGDIFPLYADVLQKEGSLDPSAKKEEGEGELKKKEGEEEENEKEDVEEEEGKEGEKRE